MRRRKGDGSIELLPSGRYRARIHDPSGNFPSLGTFADRPTAEAVLNAARARFVEAAPACGGITLREYGKEWLRRREASGYRAAHDDCNRWKAHVDNDTIADLAVEAIHPATVREWIDRRAGARVQKGRCHKKAGKRRCARQTLQNALNMLRVCLESAVPSLLKSNPARGVRVPRRPEDNAAAMRRPWTWLDEAEQAILLAAIPEPERWVVQFAIGSGLRRGEQQALPAANIRTGERPHIVVQFGGHGKPTKTKRPRTIPLLPVAADAWARWSSTKASEIKSSGLAFPTVRGERWKGTRRGWHRWLTSAGVKGQEGPPVCWHSLRHTCASMLVSGCWGSAWSLEEVCGLLGHSSISVTERYAHLAQSALFRAAARLSSTSVP
ncbi:MAG: site-specific integrase [Brevundimonas sp.]